MGHCGDEDGEACGELSSNRPALRLCVLRAADDGDAATACDEAALLGDVARTAVLLPPVGLPLTAEAAAAAADAELAVASDEDGDAAAGADGGDRARMNATTRSIEAADSGK